MKYLIFTISFLFFNLSIGQIEKSFSASSEMANILKQNNSIFSGRVEHAYSGNIKLQFHDNIISQELNQLVMPLIEKDKFGTSFTIHKPILTHVIYNGFQMNAFLVPGDSIYLKVNGDYPLDSEFVGNRSEENNFLLAFNNYFSKIDIWVENQLISNVFGPELRDTIEAIYLDKQVYINNKEDKLNGFHKEFFYFLTNEIYYWRLYKLMEIGLANEAICNIDFTILNNTQDYFSFLDDAEISNNNALLSSNYLKFIDLYLDYLKTNSRTSVQKSDYRKSEIKKQIEKTVLVTRPSCFIFKAPLQNDIVETVWFGNELEYLMNKTNERIEYFEGGVMKKSFLYKVKTPKGNIGWIPMNSTQLRVREVYRLADIEGNSNETLIEKYFAEKPLFYLKAKSLYKQILNKENINEISTELAKFRDANPYPEFTNVLSKAYEVSQLDGKGDSELLNNYYYNELTTPTIEGLRMKLPFDNSSFFRNTGVVEIPSMPLENYVTIPSYIANNSKKTKIKISASKPITVVINADPLHYYEKSYHNIYNYSKEINLEFPVTGHIFYEGKEIPIFLEPGDDLKINIFNKIRIEGTGAEKNKVLVDFALTHYLSGNYFYNQYKHKSPQEFVDFMELQVNNRKKFFNKKLKELNVTNIFRNYILGFTEYWKANKLSEYAKLNTIKLSKNKEIANNFFKYFNNLPPLEFGSVLHPDVIYLVQNFTNFKEKKIINGDFSFLSLEGKYLVEAISLKRKCENGDIEGSGPEIVEFLKCPRGKFYHKSLRNIYENAKGLVEGTPAPNFSLLDVRGNIVELEDLKGKLVFIDFWATYCAPCLETIFKSNNLSNTMGDKVEMVYISLDNNFNKWTAFVEQHNLKGVQLFANTDNWFMSETKTLFQVRKIPSYMLINQDGVLTQKSAFRPGTSVWYEMINKFSM